MTRWQQDRLLRELRLSGVDTGLLGEDEETPVDTFERRAITAIARRTRRVLAVTMTLTALSCSLSFGMLAYQVVSWLERRPPSQAQSEPDRHRDGGVFATVFGR